MEDFERAWQESVDQWNFNKTQKPDDAQTGTPGGEPNGPPKEEPQVEPTNAGNGPKNTGKKKGKKQTAKQSAKKVTPSGVGKPNPDGDVTADPKKILSQTIASAMKVKHEFVTTAHRALELHATISKDESWSWARLQKAPKLHALATALKSKLSPWARLFVLESKSVAELKKSFSTDRLMAELGAIVGMEGQVKSVETYTSSLLTAQATMKETEASDD